MLSLVGVLSLHGGSVVDICLPQQCLTFLIREIVQFLSSVAVNLVTYGCKIRSFLDVETKWVPLRSPVSQIVEIDVLVTCGNQDTVPNKEKVLRGGSRMDLLDIVCLPLDLSMVFCQD